MTRRLAAALSLALAGCAFVTPPRDTAGPRPHVDDAPAEPSRHSAEEETSLGATYDGYFRMKCPTYDDPALVGYLSTITQRLGDHAERPGIAFRVAIKDSPEYNAWSFLGGYVHIARGTLALASSEAEIAGVIAHEIGHIAVRHSLYSLFASTADYKDDPALPFPDDLHHRDGEMQADRVGFDLMRAAGYALRAVPRIYRGLQIMDLLSAHVDTTMNPRVARFSRYGVPREGGDVGRDVYLDHIDGLVFGDDPRDGMVRGQAFTCARCKLAFDLPAGWKTEMQPGGIDGQSPRHDRTMSFYRLGHPGSPDDVRVVLRKTLVASSIVEEKAAGLPVILGTVAGKDPPEELALIADGDESYSLMTGGEEARPTLRRMLATLRRPRAADMVVMPRRIRLHKVAQAGRFEDVVVRTCKPGKDTLLHALLNDVGMQEEIAAGTRLKCVEP